jgi:acetylglutamate kinase
MVQTAIDKARVLVEALPYMQRFMGRTLVIKYGGAAMKDAELRASFAVDVVLLKHIGVRPVIVHGGGPQIGALLERLGKKSTFVDGLRVTDDETMEAVEMILGGTVNREIVDLVQRGGGRAVGLTGCDGGMIRAHRRLKEGHDIGRVGEVVAVDPSVIEAVAAAGFVPVIAPIGVDDDGLTYNVNADEAAGAIAQALRAEKLILLTDVEGVLDADGRLVPELSRDRARELTVAGAVRGGMIPKLECCIAAVQGGVARAHVIDGRVQHAILLEVFTDRGVGTVITR